MVMVFPTTGPNPTPLGKPEPVAFTALPTRLNPILLIAVLSQTI